MAVPGTPEAKVSVFRVFWALLRFMGVSASASASRMYDLQNLALLPEMLSYSAAPSGLSHESIGLLLRKL